MSNTFSNAWNWSIKHSPLLSLWRAARGLIRPNREAFALLDQASLPKSIEEVIRNTIVRTKLWCDEREQIARELIAHAQDALDAGRESDRIVTTYGDPRRVARLLRRSMKRKRSFSWQAYRFFRRAVGIALLVLFVSYAALALRFYTSKPDIRVNYATMLNQRNAGYEDDQKSWPIIAETGLKWSQIYYALSNEQAERVSGLDPNLHTTGMSIFPFVKPEHPDYQSIAQSVLTFEPQLVQLREAASRPIVGIPVGYETIEVELEGRHWTREIVPADADAYKHKSMIDILLPNLGSTRGLSQVLVFDAHLAILEGDAQRACNDYIAAMGLARQLRNEPFLISNLVGIAIHAMVIEDIASLMSENHAFFNTEQLTQLAHVNALLMHQKGIGLDSERLSFDDTLQRVYSDDGRGNGQITPDGLRHLGTLIGNPNDLGESLFTDAVAMDPRLRAAAIPLSSITSRDREHESAIFNRYMDLIQKALDMGPQWIVILSDTEIEQEHLRAKSSPLSFSVVGLLLPALDKVIERYYQHRQLTSAFEAMLAIEAFRASQGTLPSAIVSLELTYLPATPRDLMDPGQALKYQIHGNRYVLYSVGSDGNDDGGVRPETSNATYPLREEQRFHLRYPRVHSVKNGQVLTEPDGRPILDAPQGPDGDWILIDTRPETETDSGES